MGLFNVVFVLCLLVAAVYSNGLNTLPIQSIRDENSSIVFGYDLLSMGEYRARKITQFINSLLPYTGYGSYSVVSYAYCPETFNTPITSLMNKHRFDVQRSVALDTNIPDLAEVVRQINTDLSAGATRHMKGGGGPRRGTQVAVLFIDPSITVISPEVVTETERLRQQGCRLFVVSVGRERCCQPKRRFYTLAGRTSTFAFPTYKQLIHSVRHTPFRFRSMCHRYTPTNKRFM